MDLCLDLEVNDVNGDGVNKQAERERDRENVEILTASRSRREIDSLVPVLERKRETGTLMNP